MGLLRFSCRRQIHSSHAQISLSSSLRLSLAIVLTLCLRASEEGSGGCGCRVEQLEKNMKREFNFILYIQRAKDWKMETKRTENYLYKLSLSIHQKNIDSTRPAIEAKMSPATSRTLELAHSRPHNRDLSHLQSHQINYDNNAIIHRLISISDRSKSPLSRYHEYSQYNEFERPFRVRNPFRTQKQRQIDLYNQKIYKSILSMRPRIGQLKEWNKEHERKKSYSNIYRKHRSVGKKVDPELLRKRQIGHLQQEIKESLNISGRGEEGELPRL